MEEQASVESQLADPEVYTDHARSSGLLRRFEECKRMSEAMLDEMAELEEKIAAVRAAAGD